MRAMIIKVGGALAPGPNRSLRLQAKLDLSVNIWNSLPNSVVHACSTVNVLIARLDKFWQYQWHQLAKFDFTADLTETDQKKS